MNIGTIKTQFINMFKRDEAQDIKNRKKELYEIVERGIKAESLFATEGFKEFITDIEAKRTNIENTILDMVKSGNLDKEKLFRYGGEINAYNTAFLSLYDVVKNKEIALQELEDIKKGENGEEAE